MWWLDSMMWKKLISVLLGLLLNRDYISITLLLDCLSIDTTRNFRNTCGVVLIGLEVDLTLNGPSYTTSVVHQPAHRRFVRCVTLNGGKSLQQKTDEISSTEDRRYLADVHIDGTFTFLTYYLYLHNANFSYYFLPLKSFIFPIFNLLLIISDSSLW